MWEGNVIFIGRSKKSQHRKLNRIQIEADVTGGEQLRALIFDKGRKIAEGLAEIKESLAKLSLDIQKAKLGTRRILTYMNIS